MKGLEGEKRVSMGIEGGGGVWGKVNGVMKGKEVMIERIEWVGIGVEKRKMSIGEDVVNRGLVVSKSGVGEA